MAEKLVEIGAIASAHGIKGQFKVKAFCDDPMDVASYGAVSFDNGDVITLKAHSHSKGFVLCSAKEVTSRNQAEGLRGTLLYVSRDQLPDASDDEIYHADLMGYHVIARGAEPVGHIIGIFDFGAGTVLEIKRSGKKPVMVPFGDDYTPQIDDDTQSLVLDIAPSWLDDSKPDKGA
jgi:16S rRNA processing protein RimM